MTSEDFRVLSHWELNPNKIRMEPRYFQNININIWIRSRFNRDWVPNVKAPIKVFNMNAPLETEKFAQQFTCTPKYLQSNIFEK